MVAQQNTFWTSNYGQMCHPHTISDQSGKYVAFNSLDRKKIVPDVIVVEY